jgi:hypothetical protein
MTNFNLFKVLKERHKAKRHAQIKLHHFINFDMDTVGWYAFGHHDEINFLTHVAKQKYRFTPLYTVKKTWVRFKDNQIEETSCAAPGTEPVTMIEFYD